jgi:hypothetical protein
MPASDKIMPPHIAMIQTTNAGSRRIVSQQDIGRRG